MDTIYSSKKIILCSLILFSLLVTSFSPISRSTSSSVTIDEEDGTWTDTFVNNENVTLDNCTIVDGTLILGNEKSIQTYSISTNTQNKAYSYKTLIFLPFLPPRLHKVATNEFTPIGYAQISKDDADMVKTTGSLFKRIVVHQFTIKIPQQIDSITQLDLFWKGKTDHDAKVSLYYWQPIGNFTGRWELATTQKSNGSILTFNEDFSAAPSDLFIDDEKNINLCIVAIPAFGTTCSLFSDYVSISSHGQGYALKGTAISSVINPLTLATWERLTADDYIKTGTSILYHILDEDKIIISDTRLPGNSEGFTGPVSLCSLLNSPTKIRIQANLTTTDPSLTPKIYSWSILWQTQSNNWTDQFNSALRVAEKNNINILNGNASLTSSYGEWPLAGQNPANTRASDGPGPSTNALYWYSSSNEHLGGGYRNPVIKNNVLYIVSLAGNQLYAFNATVDDANKGHSNSPITSISLPDIVKNTPAVTDDYVIIATGNTSDGGMENVVVAYNKNNLTEQKWQFNYKDVNPSKPAICYYSSPVVSEGKVFLTSWSGDDSLLTSLNEGNNRLIILDINDNGHVLQDKALPAGSFSNPAVSKGKVIVGCENGKNDTLLAFDTTTGDQLWKAQVGSIGRASPVVYNDKVFIVAKEQAIPLISARTMVVAVNLNDGTILWNTSISNPMLTSYELAASSPAVYNDVLYVASPDGFVHALNVNDGKEKWKQQVYKKDITSSQVLISSPAYADGFVYIGTPDGVLIALHASNGGKAWEYNQTEGHSAVLTSPVVVNGLVYFSDEHGVLYSLGAYTKAEDQPITGSLLSIPVYLSSGCTWDRFYAMTNTTNGGSIVFSILNENNQLLKNNVMNGDNISDASSWKTSIKLRAEFTNVNSSSNAILQKWSLSSISSNDTIKPEFNKSSFTPTAGWISTKTPTCTIDARDQKSGLLVTSASFTIEYQENSTNKTYTGSTPCNGTNGSTATQTITATLSNLPFSSNITKLYSIQFSISDLNGNTNSSEKYPFSLDAEKPFSYIANTSKIPKKINTTTVSITANATDNISKVASVGLYYRSLGVTQWTLFGSEDASSPYTWAFSASSGEYELCSIATDKAGNKEDSPQQGDVSFIFDPNPPDKPAFNDIYWFSMLPGFSLQFQDDFKLDAVSYRFSDDTQWTTLFSNINTSTYNKNWTLLKTDWETMQNGQTYYLYIMITDVCGNQRLLTTQSDALQLSKDTAPPQIDIDLSQFSSELQWDNVFNLSASVSDGNGSGINDIQLFYRYSQDNTTWNNWSAYGNKTSGSQAKWEFTAENGDGYYQFKIIATDNAGNEQSSIATASVNIFSFIPFAALITLFVIFVLIAVVLFVKWKRASRNNP
ncbi:MAG: PQQ-binding-like beta-propeller repeat protein [Euryarchaeota archaeon]|nr:PQQ-binding-like beta-propeller repeat protein [Euryarchaeota archaeon]